MHVRISSDKALQFELVQSTQRSRHRAGRKFGYSGDAGSFARCIQDIESEQHVPALIGAKHRAQEVFASPVGQIGRFGSQQERLVRTALTVREAT